MHMCSHTDISCATAGPEKPRTKWGEGEGGEGNDKVIHNENIRIDENSFFVKKS